MISGEGGSQGGGGNKGKQFEGRPLSHASAHEAASLIPWKPASVGWVFTDETRLSEKTVLSSPLIDARDPWMATAQIICQHTLHSGIDLAWWIKYQFTLILMFCTQQEIKSSISDSELNERSCETTVLQANNNTWTPYRC